ncbi:MAG: RNA polymerase sigma factor [Rikenellaceae bacterium]|nr:RNA polymerase sigma factor [Rikenellaceae bacterium]
MIQHVAETDLVRLVKEGNRTAMRELYDRHIRYLTGVAARYVDDGELHDVLQESFVKIYTSIGRFEHRGAGSLRAWLTRIVVNVALDHLRQGAKTSPFTQYEDIAEDTEPEVEDVAIEVIHRFIRELPPGYRTIFNLYVFEEQSHREIAQRLGISESTSASQLHRAKALLAQKIKEYKKQNQI